jgi:hypothetical protein
LGFNSCKQLTDLSGTVSQQPLLLLLATAINGFFSARRICSVLAIFPVLKRRL